MMHGQNGSNFLVRLLTIMFLRSQGKLEQKLKQFPYQNIFVPRSCIRSGPATQNLFTLDIHRRILLCRKPSMTVERKQIVRS